MHLSHMTSTAIASRPSILERMRRCLNTATYARQLTTLPIRTCGSSALRSPLAARLGCVLGFSWVRESRSVKGQSRAHAPSLQRTFFRGRLFVAIPLSGSENGALKLGYLRAQYPIELDEWNLVRNDRAGCLSRRRSVVNHRCRLFRAVLHPGSHCRRSRVQLALSL